MNAVKEWAAAICVTVLAAALLQYLVPSGSMEKMIKFIIGAFVICALIQPISQIVPKINFDVPESGQTQSDLQLKDTVDSQISAAAQNSISNLVTAELNQMNIKCENVNAIMDTHEDGRISINKVVVTLEKGYDSKCKAASEHLEKVLGLKTEVTADGGKE